MRYSRPWRCGGQRSRKRDPRQEPSRESWRSRTPSGGRPAPHQPRRRRSWLQQKRVRYKHLSETYQIGKPTGLRDGLLGKCLKGGRLKAGGVDETVVQDLDIGVVAREGEDLLGNGLGLSEGRDILAHTGEAELDVLPVRPAELRLGLLADDDEVVLAGVVESHTADSTAETGVNTTAKTLVGRADDEERLLLVLEGLGLGGLVDLVGGLTVRAGLGHGLLGAGKLRRGDDLHRLRDLLDVADGLEAALNLAEGGIAGGGVGGVGNDPDRPVSRAVDNFPSL